jgi:hypothetical protein
LPRQDAQAALRAQAVFPIAAPWRQNGGGSAGSSIMTDDPTPTEAAIMRWQGIAVPNAAGRRMAADLDHIIAQFETQRGTLRFEDEPSSFEQALLDCMDPTP